MKTLVTKSVLCRGKETGIAVSNHRTIPSRPRISEFRLYRIMCLNIAPGKVCGRPECRISGGKVVFDSPDKVRRIQVLKNDS